MTTIALQGLRGGVGVTSITCGLAWALHQLGEKVLVIDLCPDNMLRLSFNMPFEAERGWARAEIDGIPWQQSAMQYSDGLDFVPFGQLTYSELLDWNDNKRNQSDYWLDKLNQLKQSQQYQWILFDMPFSYPFIERSLLNEVDKHLYLLKPTMNDHIRLHQQKLVKNSYLLLNQYLSNSQLQRDLHLLWSNSLVNILPLMIHHDESLAEALAAKKPVGEYAADSLAATEVQVLATWCLLNAAEQTP